MKPSKTLLVSILILTISLTGCTTAPATPIAETTEKSPGVSVEATPSSLPTASPTTTPVPTNTPTPEPTILAGGGGQIAFELNQGNLQDLYIVDSSGSILTPLSFGESGDRYFMGSWSFEGTDLLYRSFNNPFNSLNLVSADGSENQNITEEFDFGNDWISPAGAWDPNGTNLYVVISYGKEDFKHEYRVYDLQDSSYTLMDFYPYLWSPDKSEGLGYSVKDGNWEIYSMAADGSNLRNLTQNLSEDRLMPAWGETAWSPDGSQILFTSDREGNTQVFVMAADGSNPVNVSQETARIYEWLWSPDGEWVYFTSDQGGNRNIWRALPSGEEKSQVTNLDGHERYLHFSPDGQYLAFISGGTNLPVGYVFEMRSGDVLRLFANTPEASVESLQWSPDGQWLYAAAQIDNQDNIYLISVDGTDILNLTGELLPTNNGITGLPAWRP